MASYHGAYNVALYKKSHTIAEEVIKPCVLQMTNIFLGKEASKKLKLVPLSNDVIQSRISDISSDFLDQVIADM